ncbi:MAG: ATP-binding protein [Prosthecobacter sp.]
MPFRPPTSIWAALLFFTGTSVLPAQQPQEAELGSVAQVLAVSAFEAGAKPRPVRLSGVVLGVNTAQTHFTLHDGVKSIGVELTQPFYQLKQGDEVEILGSTMTATFPGAAHPRVKAASIHVKGTAPLPQALPVDLPTLVSFTHFDQWVSSEAFVMDWQHANGELSLRVVANGGYYVATVRLPDATAIPARLHGARLRLTGVNAGNRTTENCLLVPSAAQLEVLEEGANDVFEAPIASVPDLMQRKVEAGRRYRVRGIVTAVSEERKIFLVTPEGDLMAYLLVRRDQDVPGTLYSSGGNWPPPQAGDVVEVVGSTFETPNSNLNASGLNWCQLRKLGTQAVPPPRAVDIETLLSWRNHDEWCSVEGTVTGWMQGATTRLYSIVDAHGWAIVQVRDVTGASFPKDLHGARLRFTGISRSRVANPGEALVVAGTSFIEVIKAGSADPFAVPQMEMRDLMKQKAPSGDRVRTRGIVTGHTGATVLYLRDQNSAICVLLQDPWARGTGTHYADAGPLPKLQPGDEVEVMGSPMQPRAGLDADGFDLYQTHVRVLGKKDPPAPVPATIAEIAAGAHTSDFVETRGRIVGVQQQSVRNEWRTTLLLEADTGERIPLVHQATKIASFSNQHVDHDVLVRAFVDRATAKTPRQLWTVDEQDIDILGVSSVVLTRRLWMYGGGGAVVMTLLLGWITMLRRHARRQARANAELKTATDAARESEQRWKLLFEQSPLSVQIFSPDGQTKRINHAWKNLFRLNDEQGYAFNVLKAPDLIASGAVEHIRKAFQGQVVHVPPVPYPIPGDPPETRWIGGVLYPVKNDAGDIIEVVTIHNDITESKRAAETLMEINHLLEKRVEERTTELQKAQSDLQHALEQERELGELKSRFVTMVSHEFRTPLGIIMSAVELLQHYSDRLPEEEKKLQLHEIQASTKHMGGLMEQVLLLGRAEAGKLTCKPQPLDLATFADRIIDETQSISNRKCSIILQTEGDLDGARVDEALLRHILGNLVSNAVKYSPAGAEVLIQLRREGPNAALIITDRGIGIPEKDRERLFEAFHRCSNVGEIQGTGLGLVIVKRCVDLHSGSLDLESEVGKGTTFTVRLPVFVA